MNKIFYGLILSCLIIKADVNQDDSLGVFKNYHNFSELDKSFLADFGIQEVPDYSNEYYHIDFFKKFVDEENVQGEDKELIFKKIKDCKDLVRTKSYNEMSQEEKDEFDKINIEEVVEEILQDKYPNESDFKYKDIEVSMKFSLYKSNIELSRAKTEEEKKKIRDEIANNKKLIAKTKIEKECLKKWCEEEGIRVVSTFEAFEKELSARANDAGNYSFIKHEYREMFDLKVSLETSLEEKKDDDEIKELRKSIEINEKKIEYVHKLLKELSEKNGITPENIKTFDDFKIELGKLYKEGKYFQEFLIKKYFALYASSINAFIALQTNELSAEKAYNTQIENLQKKIDELKASYKEIKKEAFKELLLFEKENAAFDNNKSFEDFENELSKNGNEILISIYKLLFQSKINLKTIEKGFFTDSVLSNADRSALKSNADRITKQIENLTKQIENKKKERKILESFYQEEKFPIENVSISIDDFNTKVKERYNRIISDIYRSLFDFTIELEIPEETEENIININYLKIHIQTSKDCIKKQKRILSLKLEENIVQEFCKKEGILDQSIKVYSDYCSSVCFSAFLRAKYKKDPNKYMQLKVPHFNLFNKKIDLALALEDLKTNNSDSEIQNKIKLLEGEVENLEKEIEAIKNPVTSN